MMLTIRPPPSLPSPSSSSIMCWRAKVTMVPCRRRSDVMGTLVLRRSKSTSSSSSSRKDGWITWYSIKLDTHPLLTKCISSGLIAGGGDFVCQSCFEHSQHKYDWARTGRFTLLGAAVVAPFVHAWYSFLSRMIPGVNAVAVLKRVAMDQFIFSPCFMSIWLTGLWTLEGDRDGIGGRLVGSMPSLMLANWGLWIPAQLVNFRFVPVKFQVLYSNVVALVWNCYLSYSQTRKQLHVE